MSPSPTGLACNPLPNRDTTRSDLVHSSPTADDEAAELRQYYQSLNAFQDNFVRLLVSRAGYSPELRTSSESFLKLIGHVFSSVPNVLNWSAETTCTYLPVAPTASPAYPAPTTYTTNGLERKLLHYWLLVLKEPRLHQLHAAIVAEVAALVSALAYHAHHYARAQSLATAFLHQWLNLLECYNQCQFPVTIPYYDNAPWAGWDHILTDDYASITLRCTDERDCLAQQLTRVYIQCLTGLEAVQPALATSGVFSLLIHPLLYLPDRIQALPIINMSSHWTLVDDLVRVGVLLCTYHRDMRLTVGTFFLHLALNQVLLLGRRQPLPRELVAMANHSVSARFDRALAQLLEYCWQYESFPNPTTHLVPVMHACQCTVTRWPTASALPLFYFRDALGLILSQIQRRYPSIELAKSVPMSSSAVPKRKRCDSNDSDGLEPGVQTISLRDTAHGKRMRENEEAPHACQPNASTALPPASPWHSILTIMVQLEAQGLEAISEPTHALACSAFRSALEQCTMDALTCEQVATVNSTLRDVIVGWPMAKAPDAYRACATYMTHAVSALLGVCLAVYDQYRHSRRLPDDPTALTLMYQQVFSTVLLWGGTWTSDTPVEEPLLLLLWAFLVLPAIAIPAFQTRLLALTPHRHCHEDHEPHPTPGPICVAPARLPLIFTTSPSPTHLFSNPAPTTASIPELPVAIDSQVANRLAFLVTEVPNVLSLLYVLPPRWGLCYQVLLLEWALSLRSTCTLPQLGPTEEHIPTERWRQAAWRVVPIFMAKQRAQSAVVNYTLSHMVLDPTDTTDLLLCAATSLQHTCCALAGSLHISINGAPGPWYLSLVCHHCQHLAAKDNQEVNRPTVYFNPSGDLPLVLQRVADTLHDAGERSDVNTANSMLASVPLRQWASYWFIVSQRQEPALRLRFGRVLAHFLSHAPLIDYCLDKESQRQLQLTLAIDDPNLPDAASADQGLVFAEGCLRYLSTSLRGLQRILGTVLCRYAQVPCGPAWPSHHRAQISDLRSRNQQAIVKHILDMLEVTSPQGEPNLLMVLGSIGGFCTDSTLLGHILKTLLERRMRPNLFIRAVALTQLTGIATHRQQPLTHLFRAYLPALSVFLVQCWEMDRVVAAPAIRLLGYSVQGFVHETLSYTLPELFAMNREATLLAITSCVAQDLSVLCINHAHAILARLFLLDAQAMPAAMRLFLSITTRGFDHVTLTHIIRSCSLQLIRRLTQELGVDDQLHKLRAASALRMVVRKLCDQPAPAGPEQPDAKPTGDLPEKEEVEGGMRHNASKLWGFLEEPYAVHLLRKYFLGILAAMNETLTEAPELSPMATKLTTLQSLTELIKLLGSPVQRVSSHIMATLRTALALPELRGGALEAWYVFALSVQKANLGPFIGELTGTLGLVYPECTRSQRRVISQTLDYALFDNLSVLMRNAERLALLPSSVPEFNAHNDAIWFARGTLTIPEHLDLVSDLLTVDNHSVVELALDELSQLLRRHPEEVYRLVQAEQVDENVVRLVHQLLDRCSRVGGHRSRIGKLSSRCLGQLGAIDPTRLSLATLSISTASPSPANTLYSTTGTTAHAPPFFDLAASEGRVGLACYILEHRVVNRLRSAKSPQEQGYYAYTIQELLKLCRFSTRTLGSLLDGAKSVAPTLAVQSHTANEPSPSTTKSADKYQLIHARWEQFSSDVKETLLTLLDAKYAIQSPVAPTPDFPVYRSKAEFGDWLLAYIQGIVWHTSCPETRVLMEACYPVLRCEEDHQLALFILPYAIVYPLGSDAASTPTNLVDEIKVVLEAAESEAEAGPSNYFYLCAQTVFRMMDQLTWWKVQEQSKLYRQAKAARSTSRSADTTDAHQLPLALACDRLGALDPATLAKAAMVCRDNARALLYYERTVQAAPNLTMDTIIAGSVLPRLLKLYDRVDDPDGVEGIATLMPHSGTDQQLHLFESTGRWVAAQACYELKLKQEGHTLATQQGFINCLRQLGHLESMLTHIRGLLADCPDWEPDLRASAIEASWRLSKWDSVDRYVSTATDPPVLAADDRSSPTAAILCMPRVDVTPRNDTFEVALGRLLLSLHRDQVDQFRSLMDNTREHLLAELAVTGKSAYAASYPYVVQLHMLYELEAIVDALHSHQLTLSPDAQPLAQMDKLLKGWDQRLAITMPSFQIREPILNLRRVVLQVLSDHAEVADWEVGLKSSSSALQPHRGVAIPIPGQPLPTPMDTAPEPLRAQLAKLTRDECGRLWLVSAKTARKEGYLQTAFSALLNATDANKGWACIERAKWYWNNQQARLAILELQQALQRPTGTDHSQALPTPSSHIMHATRTSPSDGTLGAATTDTHMLATANLLLTKWMETTHSSNSNTILVKYDEVHRLQPRWEKAFFLAGRYYNKFLNSIRQRDLVHASSDSDYSTTPNSANGHTDAIVYLICRNYGKALACGNKYIYQTMPRLLTIWLDFGAEIDTTQKSTTKAHEDRLRYLTKVNNLIQNLVKRLPTYQFLTAFSQIISRICHPNPQVFVILERIIMSVLIVFPHQALWSMMAVLKSTVRKRQSRCNAIFAKVRSDPTAMLKRIHVEELIQQATKLTDQLLQLCNYPVPPKVATLRIGKEFRTLQRMTPLQLIIPLQRSLTVTLPTSSQTLITHHPFPGPLPTIHAFEDVVEVMHSLQKPKKVTVRGSDGQRYTFLCKPKDDLRKDSRTMEFNAMINKLLLKDTETRRRQLYIRTYAVIPLNEECGLIEWVPHTTGYRHIVMELYRRRQCVTPIQQVRSILERKDPHPGQVFVQELLPKFPPVFYEWFLNQFPDPAQWLRSRQRYVRTLAVMSMVGYILGLGDRHGENILFDDTTGDCVHVDFSCLFEKGLTLEKPERVPFRLTHNMVHAMGITGHEGPFRRTCEATMNVLRTHKDSLMCVLETFIHDPLCEWSRRRPLIATASSAAVGAADSQNRLAVTNLANIKRKLDGWAKNSIPMSVEGQVDELIQQATNTTYLFHMYIGWAAYL